MVGVWYGMAGYGMTWHGRNMVWHGMVGVSLGMAWCMVWHAIAC